MKVYAVYRSPPSRNQVIRVPNLPPASPHSCRWSRLPRFQCAAANPIKLTIAKKKMKTPRAVQFRGIELPFTAGLGAPPDQSRHAHADENPQQLKPVEKGKAEQFRLDAVV